MRSVTRSKDDKAFDRLVQRGPNYDYELGDRYVVAPMVGRPHAALQASIIAILLSHFGADRVTAPTNLGVLGRKGRRWYVVPDVVVFPSGADSDDRASLHAVLAIEICSPNEDPAKKLADYRTVMERSGLVVEEVWYVNGAELTVHPGAAHVPGDSAHPAALAAIRLAVTNFAAGRQG
ncbi:MAG: Uma2 family endonuclease [Acidimicrobiales bacterium]